MCCFFQTAQFIDVMPSVVEVSFKNIYSFAPYMPYLFFLFATVGVLFQVSSSYLKRDIAQTFNTSVSSAPYDAIIIPGIPYDEMEENWMLKARMCWANQLFDRGIAKNIIFSGAAVHTPYVEGRIMKLIADSMGIPANHTFIEEKALHGTENIDYGYRMARSMGFKKIAVATDPFQTFFLHYLSGQNADGVVFLPFPPDSMDAFNRNLPAINTTDAYINNFVPLKNR